MRRLAACLVVLVTACAEPVSSPTTAVETSEPSASSVVSEPPTTPTTAIASSTTTSPAGPVEPILVLGDWGTGTMPQGAIAGAMATYGERQRLAAILTTGDNFYDDDAEFLMHPFDWVVASGTPFWITLGNADIESPERIAAVNEAFGNPPPWTTHRWGAVTVVILDSNRVEDVEQIEYLVDELDRIDGPTLVTFHHPPFSCSGDGGEPGIVNELLPLLDRDVFLVLSGHAHNYQRFVDGDRSYVITGGGGAPLDGIGDCPDGTPELVESREIHHFLAIEQDEASVTIDVINATGVPVSTFTIVLG